MRPLHALLLVVALAVALLAGLFLIGSDDRIGAPTAVGDAASGGEHAGTPGEANLQAPDGGANGTSRAVKPGASGVNTPTDASAKWAKSDAPGFALKGRVVTSTGRPIANATVYAAAAQGLTEISLDEMDPKDMPWLQRVDAVTDADGRFMVKPQARGSVRFAVRASGFAPKDSEVAIAGTGQDIGDIVLDAGVVLSGRVVDSAGRPVAGAELHSKRESGGGGIVIMGGTRGALLSKTDAQGRFKVDQLASGPWKLGIYTEDHPDKIESGEADRAGSSVANLEFVLEDGVEIQGRVVDAPAQALQNVSVRATLRPSGPGDESGGSSFASDVTASPFAAARRAKCGADGSFTLRGLKKGQNYRIVGREGEDFGGRTRTQALQVKAGERGIQLKWKPETAIVFQVVDAITNAPLTDFTVEAGFGWSLPLTGEDGKPQKHFKDGKVRFANLPQKPDGQSAELAVEAIGYKRYERKGLDPIEGQDLDLGVVRLERAPLVKVLVLDDTSAAPIANASVSLAVEEPQDNMRRMVLSFGNAGDGDAGGAGSAQRARTDAEGRASVTSLPGKQAVLRVRQGNYAAYASAPMQLSLTDDVEVTVRLTVGGTVVVQVVDAKGKPVAGQSVQHQGPDGNEAPLMIGGDSSDESDASGKVVFEHLEAGPHKFRLREGADDMMAMEGGAVFRAVRRGGESKNSAAGWSEVQVGEKTHEEVRLVTPARSTLTGRITEGGKPLTGATVRLTDKSDDPTATLPFFGEGKDARTTGKGEYTLENVKEGEYRVTVTHATRAMSFETSTVLREGENKLDVELPICTIEGRATNSEGKPLAGVRMRAERSVPEDGKTKTASHMIVFSANTGDDSEVSFTSSTGGGEAVLTDADGKYKLRGVLSDVDLVVKATGKDVQPGQSAVVRLVPDQTKSGVDLTLLQGGSIEVTIQHADGRAGASCIVRGRIDGDPVDPKTEFSGATGIVKLTGLKPGKWRVTVSPIGPGTKSGPDNQEIPEQVIEVKAGESGKARFEIP